MRIFLLFILLSAGLSAKVRLLTFHYNAPELIEMQYKTFKKFMLDDYELIVFNDGNTPEREKAIREMCDRYEILCIRYEQEWHLLDPLNQQIKDWLDNPKNHNHAHPGLSVTGTDLQSISTHASVRHCHVIQFAINNFGYWHDDVVAIVDGDLMPIRAVSIKGLLSSTSLIGINKYWWADKVEYLWVPFIAFDPKRVPDLGHLRFHVAIINNKLFDSGSQTYHYLKEHPEINAVKYPATNEADFSDLSLDELCSKGYTEAEAELLKALPWPYTVELHIDNHFLHFGASSFDTGIYEEKFLKVSDFLEKIMN